MSAATNAVSGTRSSIVSVCDLSICNSIKVQQFWGLAPRYSFFFFNYPSTTEIYTLSLHDALPIWIVRQNIQDLGDHPRSVPRRARMIGEVLRRNDPRYGGQLALPDIGPELVEHVAFRHLDQIGRAHV